MLWTCNGEMYDRTSFKSSVIVNAVRDFTQNVDVNYEIIF
jgi:hypothetical protein